MDGEQIRLEALTEAVLASHPPFQGEERIIARRLYGVLREGNPVPVWRLAARLHMPVTRLNQVLSRWPHLLLDDNGAVEGFGGLSIRPTPHRLALKDHALYAWSAWHALLLPRVLGETAEITSECAQCHGQIRIHASAVGPSSVEPAGTVLSFVTADTARIRERLLIHFGEYVHFLCDAAEAEEWVATRPQALILTLDEAFELGRRKLAAQFGRSEALAGV